ncbi:MAG: hypothetical protein N2170_02330 [Bacteroidia bacterium]|nr:hypothetical protein [Bacteroidia bacterium]
MRSTKRYYSLQEVGNLLRVPLHQARRWVRLFLSLPPHKTLRIPAEALPLLRRVREGVYIHRLRGEELFRFVQEKTENPTTSPWPDYPLLLSEILMEIDLCLEDMNPPPSI